MNGQTGKRGVWLLVSLAVLLASILVLLSASYAAKSALFQGLEIRETTVVGFDGAKLRAVVYKPLGAKGRLPAVIVVHGLGSSSDTMNAISTELARNGVLVLALNYRGHDGSEGGLNYIGDPVTAPNMSNDLVAALSYLAARDDVDPSRIGVVGYSMGSRAALRLGILVPTVNPVVMIGPYVGWEIGGVNTTRPKNLLVVVGGNDIITPPSLGELIFNYATFSAGKPSEVFGSFADGTARKLVVVPGADHYTVIFAKQTIDEVVSWVLSSYGMGKPSYSLDPGLLASLSSSASFWVVVGVVALLYLASRYTAAPVAAEGKPGKGGLMLAVVLAVYYLLAGFLSLPLVVEWGWEVYQFAMFSGAQYTIYYFLSLSAALLLFMAVYSVVRRGFPASLKKSIAANAVGGFLAAVLALLYVYIAYNISLTGVVANYSMTPVRVALMLYLAALLLPMLLVDEAALRLLIQDAVPARRWWVRFASAAVAEYLLRVIPLAVWVSIAANPLAVEGALAPYVSLGLISKDASEVVKAFLPMNAYGLYYAFASVEMLHAVSASYAYERYRSILATALLRALTIAFTMAAVLAIL